MALQLTKNASRDFSGKPGKKVLLGITGAGGSPATILATYYNGVALDEDEAEITLATGEQGLIMVIASIEGTRVSILERDRDNSNNTQVLAQSVFHKSGPSVTILIRVP